MTISGSQLTALNHCNEAFHRSLAGTAIATAQADIITLQAAKMKSGSHAVTAAQANGSSITLYTAVADATGYIVNLYSASGSYSGSATPYVVISASGSFTILPNAAYSVQTGQKIFWIAY